MRFFVAAIAAAALLAVLTAVSTGCGPQAITQPPETTPSTPAASSLTTTTQTPGAAGGASTYTFAVCGDNRVTGLNNGVMQNIVDSAKSHGAQFIIDMGDVTTTGANDELVRYKQFTDAAGIPFYTVPGNHDVGQGGTSAAYENVIGPPYYSFDSNGDHFVIVDNADDETGISETQRQWIGGDLAANAGKPHQFVFAHIPVASTELGTGHATGESGTAGLESGNWLISEVDRYPDVVDLFFGHIHGYINYHLDDKQAYVTGGAGAPLIIGGYFHYLLVHVTPGGVTVEVVKVG